MNGMVFLATLDEAAEKFGARAEGASPGVVALLVVLLIALAALGVYIVMRLAALRRRPAGDLALFAELAEAHGLHPADRKYLIGLARREGLDDPARLFIEKRHLEAWAKSSTDPTPRALFAQLFGE